MKHYYHGEGDIRIYHGDVLDLLGGPILYAYPVDLIFADPPFNVGKDYGVDKDRRGDYYYWCAQWIGAAWPTCKDSGSFYLMTIGRHLGRIYPIMHCQGEYANHISWPNTANGTFPTSFRPDAQPILFYTKTKTPYFNKYAEAGVNRTTRWDGKVSKNKPEMKDIWDDIAPVYTGSISHPEAILQPGSNSKVHPAQMPEALAKRIISFSCPPGGLVLDLFMGSGTMAKAANDLGRRYIGIDINEKFCALAADRLSTAGPAPKVRDSQGVVFEQGKLDI